jgi:hypothetical protein
MRSSHVLAAVALGAAFAAPANAQTPVVIGSNNPTVTYSIVDTSQPTMPLGSGQTGFPGVSLASFFHWPSARSTTPVVGVTTLPTQSQMPGVGYLQNFGYQTFPNPNARRR